MLHIYDYLESPGADPIAKEYLDRFLVPAFRKDTAWLEANIPIVTWRGEDWFCVGASRMGDVWLRKQPQQVLGRFYERRVDVAELSNWRRPFAKEQTMTDEVAVLRKIAKDMHVVGYHGWAQTCEQLSLIVDALKRERDMSATLAGRALTELHEKVSATAAQPPTDDVLRSRIEALIKQYRQSESVARSVDDSSEGKFRSIRTVLESLLAPDNGTQS